MAMTKAQWDKTQSKLPPEDRTSYQDYLASAQAVEDTARSIAATPRTTAKAAPAPATVVNPVAAAIPVAGVVSTLGASAAPTAEPVKPMVPLTPQPINYATTKIYDRMGNLVEVYTEGPQAGYSVADGSLVIQGEAPNTNLGNMMSGLGGGGAGSDRFAGLTALLSSYGVDGIANMVDKVIADYPESDGDEILNLLRYDQRYNKPYMERFAGNAARLKNKMPLLSEDAYLKQELGYSKMFASYGLKNLDNREQYTRLIAADIDIDEATQRVSMAYDRVLKAEPSTMNAFRRFFPMLSNQDLVSAMLNPEEQLPALERKVQSAEIGGAALRQSLVAELADTSYKSSMYSNVQAGTIGAGTIETAGVTPATAVAKYEKIATDLPTMEKLSSIYGSTLDQYGQREAEQAEILGLASAKRKKTALIAREEASYQGSAGTTRASFGKPRQGTI
jgi:hypothetical protein